MHSISLASHTYSDPARPEGLQFLSGSAATSGIPRLATERLVVVKDERLLINILGSLTLPFHKVGIP
jgi:hypothetical protein